MYYTYILRIHPKEFYIGFSTDLKTRISEHKNRRVLHTKYYSLFSLEFYAAFVSKKKALDFEKYLKTNSGFAFRNKRFINK